MAYTGSVDLISGIRPKNNGDFPLVDAKDVRIDDDHRLSDWVTGQAATLDSEGKIPEEQLPSYAHSVLIYPDKSSFPDTGVIGKFYVDLASSLLYRWDGKTYIDISQSLMLGETHDSAFYGDLGAKAYEHAVTNRGVALKEGLYVLTTNAEGHVISAREATKSDIGLGNVDNTSDTDKPSSRATLLSETNARKSAEYAAESEQNAEAWAVGTRGSTPVKSDDEAYQNSSRYHAQEAQKAKDLILGMKVKAITLAPGSDATATYKEGEMTLGIPAGHSGGEYVEETINEIREKMIHMSISDDGTTLNITTGEAS